jgi:hypothetical protein
LQHQDPDRVNQSLTIGLSEGGHRVSFDEQNVNGTAAGQWGNHREGSGSQDAP